LHVLSRFTFGPTPEDVEALTKAGPNGIDRWFEEQLHPERISDAPLLSRLAQYPAMQLDPSRLMVSFPGNAQIRQVVNGKLPIPDDPAFSAIYRHQLAVYEAKQEKKSAAKDKNQPAMEAPAGTMPGVAKSADSSVESSIVAASGSDTSKLRDSSIPIHEHRKADANRPVYGDLLVNSILSLPPQQRTNRILNMQPVAYEQFHSNLKGPARNRLYEGLNPAQRELLADFDNPSRAVVEEMQSQRLIRDIYTRSQLAEVMTTFWLNHFNIFLHKNEETPYYLVSYERDVIRPNALGKFENLLTAVAQSPAMLIYLDNSSSTGPDSASAEKARQREEQGKPGKPKSTPQGINENYARELMELHTLGVNGGYTQKDVTEVAKVFTGWTVDRPGQGGGFKFDESRHEPGKKVVLGHKIKEGGIDEGFQVLHLLATSPATAHFLSKELAIAFVSDNPPASLVDKMAAAFHRSGGDIPTVLRTMLHAPEFWSPDAFQAKVKTPLEYVVSAARASGADVTNPQPLINALNQMGMPLYGCVPPTGYADTADTWVSTGALVSRMNFALSLAGNKFPGVRPSWSPVAPSASPGSPGVQPQAAKAVTPEPAATPTATDTEQQLEARLIPTGVSSQTRSTIAEQVQSEAGNGPPEKQFALSAGLLLGSPEFQRR
jgi:uncharacterized protein (DUF1800 family)